MINYLVFERYEPTHGEVVDPHGRSMVARRMIDPEPRLHPYNCVGAVRAKDPEAAIQAVIRVTRRVGAYAVLEAEFIDLTASFDGDDTPLLNP